jgi:hypothetical protein
MKYADSRKQEMYDWFKERFTSPESESARKNGLDKYLYSCGGPYCPREILPSNFSGIFPDEVINEVAKDLEHERSTWAMRKTEAPQFI